MRLGRRPVVVLALLAGALWVGGPAGAETGTETSVVVADEAEYRAAVIALSADSNGPHTITLTADIVIDDGTDPVYTGLADLTIIGNGHALDGPPPAGCSCTPPAARPVQGSRASSTSANAIGGAFLADGGGTPVVDHAPAADCYDDLDQRLVERPFGSACEAGALEQVFPPHAFGDVPAWVEDAVRWLASDVNDPALITGITPTTFRPNDPITRAQVARMDYRLAITPAAWANPGQAPLTVPFGTSMGN